MKQFHFLPFFAAPLLASCSSPDKIMDKPNVIFIMADDLGWTDLSCYGSRFYETPNLDSLAAKGVRFTNAYAACPVSSPTRVSFQTGRYPAREHITDWIPGKYGNGNERMKEICPVLPPHMTMDMPLERVTIAEAMKEGGYVTAHIGKWHCCLSDSTYFPEAQGYDYNIGGCQYGSPVGPNPYFVPYNNPRMPDGPAGEYLTDRLGDECVKIIRENKDKPFFINLCFHQVHIPLNAKPERIRYFEEKAHRMGLDTLRTFIDNPDYISKQPFPKEETQLRERIIQSNPVYAAMIWHMDDNIGKILRELKAQGLDKNTIIMFMSDNGGVSTSEGSPTSNLPLRGGKGFCYEGGIREPMIVYWPGHDIGTHVSDAVITSTDFYPTILDLAKLPEKPHEHLDGVSFMPVLEGKKDFNRGDIFWHYPHYSNQGSRPAGAVRSGDFKLIENYDDGSIELYNLVQDIGEQKNLADSLPQKAQEMKAKLHEWLQSVQAQYVQKNPDYVKRK